MYSEIKSLLKKEHKIQFVDLEEKDPNTIKDSLIF